MLPALLDGQTRGRAQQAACSIEQAKVHGADMAGRGLPTASGGASQVCGPTFADPQRAVEALREAARGPDFLAACSVPTECAAYVKALGAIYTATPDEAGGGSWRPTRATSSSPRPRPSPLCPALSSLRARWFSSWARRRGDAASRALPRVFCTPRPPSCPCPACFARHGPPLAPPLPCERG